MRVLFMFVLRVLFMAFSIPALGLTAATEYMSAKPDWVFWRKFNEPLISRLPWSSYKGGKS